MKNIFILLVFSFLLPSCSGVISKMYGVKSLTKFDEEKIKAFVNTIDKGSIEMQSIYGDSISYTCSRNLVQSKTLKNGLSQPIQILYFDDTDSLVSLHANCYAKGSLTSLNWNTDNRFSQFVPESAVSLDSAKFTFTDVSQCYKQNYKLSSTKKYTVVICWSLMLEKVSKDAIKTVIDNIKQFEKQNDVAIVLVNNDRSFLDSE